MKRRDEDTAPYLSSETDFCAAGSLADVSACHNGHVSFRRAERFRSRSLYPMKKIQIFLRRRI